MAGSINAVSSVTNGKSDASQISSMNNNQIFTQLINSKDNPKLATLLLNQMTTNNVNSILFGNENNTTSSTDNIDFGVSGSTGTTNVNDMFGTSAFSSVSPQFELSVYSSLIGKIVTATDPSSGKEITGNVKSVLLENGKVMLDVNGVKVPPENLSRITK